MTGTKSRTISSNKSKVIEITFEKDIQTLTLQEFSLHFWGGGKFHFCAQTYKYYFLVEEISALIFEFQTYCFLEEQALPLLGKRLWDSFSDTGIHWSIEVKYSNPSWLL